MADETTKQAVALRYDGERAPHVSSKGEGDFAEQILAMARESGLYIHQDPALLERLGALKEGESVPPHSMWSSPRSWLTPTCCRASIQNIGEEQMEAGLLTPRSESTPVCYQTGLRPLAARKEISSSASALGISHSDITSSSPAPSSIIRAALL